MTARLQVRAAELFPDSPAMQAKWIRARQMADAIRPQVSISKCADTVLPFIPRTMKQAEQQHERF